MTIQYYYRAGLNRREGGYYGEIYHWENHGSTKVVDVKTDYYKVAEEAIDAAVELAEEQGLEPLEME